MEEEVRELIREQSRDAWVFTGNVFLDEDENPSEPDRFIGGGRVAVPTHCFKAILQEKEDGSFTAYGFLLPNLAVEIPGVHEDYEVTIDRLEALTGFDFF